MMNTGLGRGFDVGIDTDGSSDYGLVTSHAYEVLGTYQLTTNGAVVH
jgi:hypothetical protein